MFKNSLPDPLIYKRAAEGPESINKLRDWKTVTVTLQTPSLPFKPQLQTFPALASTHTH